VLSNSIRLFTIRGVEVGVHYSWLIVFALVTWSIGGYVLPEFLPNSSPAEHWALGAVTALLLFASVLIHELAHSFVAKARGLDARSITLFIFGGVSNLGGEAKEASTEFLVAIVGPLASFVLAAVAFGVASLVTEPRTEVVASYVFWINLSLGIFNLIPGFPLDGGRVLRAVLWRATGSARRATEWAAAGGKIVAYLMFGVGIYMLLVNSDIISGLWISAIAWFLHNAASATVQQAVLETRLGRLKARDVVRELDATAPPGISVAELVDEYMLPNNLRAVPVTDNTRLVGIVTVSDVMRVPVEKRRDVFVAQIMGGRDGMHTVRGDSRVLDAIQLMAEHDLEQLPVLDDGRLVGLLTRADVMRQLHLREALNV
jgi:Zn-dependent protease/CBS domain-containing protein